MSHFAIYRHAKLKSLGLVHASAQHMTRERDTPNADPARADQNRVLIGGADPGADVAALVPSLDATDEGGNRLRRSNSVLAIEVLLSASPEWWADASPEQQQGWLDRSTAWLVDEYGRENIAHLRLHADEQTPHLTGYVVPLDPETGRLNARRWIGGAARCAQQQTDYAAAVAPVGLVRGVEGSTAKHESVKRHYGQIAKPIARLSIDRPPRVLLDPEGWAEEQGRSLTKQAGPAFARAKTAESDRTARKAAEAQATKDRARVERTQAALDKQKELAGRMRALPLPEVLSALGFEQDPKEPERWRADGFNITLGTGNKTGKWFDHLSQRGSGGAIDLVQHTMGSDFKGALAWMSSRFGAGATAADLTATLRRQAVAQVKEAVLEREPFTPPAPAPEHWSHVRQHLVEERALPESYIDKLNGKGDCYADARRNAVFICRDEAGKMTGAELKGTVTTADGTRFSGMAPGSQKESGGFRIGSVARAAVVYLVESAIDAISLAKLRTLAGDKDFSVISTAGTAPEPRGWFAGLSEKIRRVCAFDRDKTGDRAAEKLALHGFERMRPTGKDWNDDLRALTESAADTGGERMAATASIMAQLRQKPAPTATPDPGKTPEPDDEPSGP